MEVIVIGQDSQRFAEDGDSESSRFLYIHTDLQEIAALTNLGAFLAQGKVLVFRGEQLEPNWLDRAHAVLEAPAVALATSSKSLADLDSRDLVIRHDCLNSTEGFLPGLYPDRVRITAEWEQQHPAEGYVFFKETLPTESASANLADWVGLNPREFVERAAGVILGKQADPSELAELTRRIEAGESEKGEVLRELLQLRVGSGLSRAEFSIIPEAFLDESTYLYSFDELLQYNLEAFGEECLSIAAREGSRS